MRWLKFSLKLIGRTLAVIISFLLIYVIAVFSLPYISVNSDYKPDDNSVEIYLLTNGVHTDLVVPFRHDQKDWSHLLDPGDTRSKDTSVRYVSFGWGDKGFYIETPTWAELKLSTAVNALCYMSSSAMHVTFYNNLEEGSDCRKVRVSRKNYEKLVSYIENSFKKTEDGKLYKVEHSYGDNDLFFDAVGKYSFFTTCNTWANSGLKDAGLKACFWTALDKGIFYHYQSEE